MRRVKLKRFFIAYAAAAGSALMCLAMGHIEIDPHHPLTVFRVFQHKCGVLMVLCVVWLWYEALRLLLRTMPGLRSATS